MKPLTRGAILAWQVAALEARLLGSEFIEREHLFIGVLSLEKILGGKKHPMEGVEKEWDAIASLLSLSGHDPVVLRRLMRAELRTRPGGSESPDTLHRSPRCRRLFVRAGFFARDRPVSSNHLFSAIMEQPGGTIAIVLADARSCIPARRDSDCIVPESLELFSPDMSQDEAVHRQLRLEEEIRIYAAELKMWGEDSGEYAFLLQQIRTRARLLAEISLAGQDFRGIFAALHAAAAWFPHEGERILQVTGEIGRYLKDNRPLPLELQEKIRDLLRILMEIEREDADEGAGTKKTGRAGREDG